MGLDNINELPLKDKISLTERELLLAEKVIKANQVILENRHLTVQERKIIIDKVNSISEIWSVSICDRDDSNDEKLLQNAETAIKALQSGMLFMKNPKKEIFDRIIEIVKVSKYWESIMYFFQPYDCYSSKTNWLLLSYEQIYNDIPENRRYEIGTQVYTRCGFDFPTYLIIDLQKLRPANYLDNVPENIRNKNYLTVYRASFTEPAFINDSIMNSYPIGTGGEISWTLSPRTAYGFYLRKSIIPNAPPCFLYSGLINVADIIYYHDAQSEILQFQSIRDVKQIPNNSMLDMAIKEICGMSINI